MRTCDELLAGVQPRVQLSIPFCLSIPPSMQCQLVCLHPDYQHMAFPWLNLCFHPVLKNEDIITFFKQQSTRTEHSNNKKELGWHISITPHVLLPPEKTESFLSGHHTRESIFVQFPFPFRPRPFPTSTKEVLVLYHD